MVGGDTSLFGNDTATTTGGGYDVVGGDTSLFGDGTTTANYDNGSQDTELPGGSTETVNYDVATDVDPLFGAEDQSNDQNVLPGGDQEVLPDGDEDVVYEDPEDDLPTASIVDGGGDVSGEPKIEYGASVGGSSDPSRFRKGLTYQLFSPQSVIPSAQRNYVQGLPSSAQRPVIDTPVSKSLFGEFFA